MGEMNLYAGMGWNGDFFVYIFFGVWMEQVILHSSVFLCSINGREASFFIYIVCTS